MKKQLSFKQRLALLVNAAPKKNATFYPYGRLIAMSPIYRVAGENHG